MLLATPRIPSYQPKEHYDGIGTTKNIGEWTTPTLASTNSHRVPFPSLHTNPSQLDAKHTPNPFTPHALAIPSHRMPFPSLHTACPPCTRIITNLLEKITQKWRISRNVGGLHVKPRLLSWIHGTCCASTAPIIACARVARSQLKKRTSQQCRTHMRGRAPAKHTSLLCRHSPGDWRSPHRSKRAQHVGARGLGCLWPERALTHATPRSSPP